MLDPDLGDHEGVLGNLRGRRNGRSSADVDHRPGPAPTGPQDRLDERNPIRSELQVRVEVLENKRTLLLLLLLVVVLMVVAAVLVTFWNRGHWQGSRSSQ